jgi:hypothetical protein
MFLEILLITLIICMISITTLAYLWWRKYGRKLFGFMESTKSMNKIFNSSNNKFGDLENSDMEMLTNRLNQLKDLVGNLKSNQKKTHFRK